MADATIEPSILAGCVTLPSSKSHTMRAILFAALARGVSRIEHFLPSPDCEAMIRAVEAFGASVRIADDALLIEGTAGSLQAIDDVVQCGNSGLVLRFIGALAGLSPSYTILTGDDSIRRRRPVQPLLDGLNQLGAFAASSRGDGGAPIIVKGPFSCNRAVIDGADSQPVSGLLIASAFAPHPIDIEVIHPGEKPWVDLTLSWFRKIGISYSRSEYSSYHLDGPNRIEAFTDRVPGDWSAAAFPIAAALATRSTITIQNADITDAQGDQAIISVLRKMGAHFCIDRQAQSLTVEKSDLQGIAIDANDLIDALPTLAVIGCFAKGRTEIVNAAIARKKESDRIASIVCELKKMGAAIEEKEDGLIVYESALHGADLSSHQDHRLAMSLSAAALAAHSPSRIRHIECSAKSYPAFYRDLQRLGAKIRL